MNSGPVLTPDTVDFPIKSAMIPEMFNILGFHLPQESLDNKYIYILFLCRILQTRKISN